VHSQEKKKSNVELWLEQSSSDEDYVEDGDTESHPHYLPDHELSSSDLTDHWYIQKLVKYIKVDELFYDCRVCLCSRRQQAIFDSNSQRLRHEHIQVLIA
jgi:hypothetical protein